MTLQNWMAVGFAVSQFCLSGCVSPAHDNPSSASEIDREIVERTIRSSISWALTKNKALLDSCFTHNGDLLIYNPYSLEPNIGFDHLERNWEQFWSKDDFKATRFDMRDLHLVFSQTGDVAWYAAIMDDVGEWQGREGGWLNTRWTGVLERRQGRWVIVQQHFSFATDPTQGSGG